MTNRASDFEFASLRTWAVCLIALGHFAAAAHAEIWLDGWDKSPQNPVLSLTPGAFDSHNIFGPAIAKHDGTYYLYYSGGPSGPLTGQDYINHQLGLATSNDGVNFTKLGQPLLPLGVRDDFHATPALLRDPQGNLQRDDDGTWHMFYNGNRADDVEHATSLDGIHWTKDPHGAIFEKAYAPNLMQVGDEYWMYYIHKPAAGNWEVRLATGPDIYSMQPHSNNPVIENSQPWEASHLVYPYVFQDDGVWVMFYAGYWDGPLGGQKTAIGTATSADGVNWTKNPDNPVFTPTPGSPYDSVYTSSQAIIRDGDVYRMFYAGRVNSIHKYFSINLATKPIDGPPATTLQWNRSGLGDWGLVTNWSGIGGGTAVPNGTDVTAIFGDSLSGPSTIVLGSPVTLKTVQFDSPHSYALAGNGSIQIESDTGAATIENLQGAHQFQTVVELQSNTTVHAASGTVLEFNNRLNLNGYTLLKSGAGLVSINNVLSTGGGVVQMEEGGLSGAGTLDGDLVNLGGMLSPGNSPGQMKVAGSFTQASEGALRMELAGISAISQHDVLEVGGAAKLSGALQVELLGGFQPRNGDTFKLFHFHSVHGSFEQIELPVLTEGLAWDTSQLYAQGVLRAVPEPRGSLSLLLGAIGALLTVGASRTTARCSWPSLASKSLAM
ncbi:MAG: hypothetical protein WD851_03395 [Pirellulales bacterium]